MRQQDLSFIVTARNEDQDVLNQTIKGLLSTSSSYPREILLIDDASEALVVRSGPEIEIIRNEKPLGRCQSRRLGAGRARGSVLVWVDSHMTFADDWLEQMLQHVDSGAFLCSAFWNYERSICHGYGADFEWMTRDPAKPTQSYPGFRLRHRTRFPGSGAVEVPMLIGGCYMALRSSYLKLGGICPLFRVCDGNEQELSARAWIRGLGVRCVTAARVGHLWRPRFPYAVQYADLEFNQLAMIRTLFEQNTISDLDKFFQPYSEQVQQRLKETSFDEWRQLVQTDRQMSDPEFFARFVPGLEKYLGTSEIRTSIRSRRFAKRHISFVVTARDETPAVLACTIENLLETSHGHSKEIVVVDDGSRVPVDLHKPDVVVLRNPQATGVSQSRRLGGSHALGDILVWVDAHMRFSHDWLDHMLEEVDSGALLCASWWEYDLSRPLCWGAEFLWCGERDHKQARSPGLSFRHLNKCPGEGAHAVPMVIGACYMMLRKSYEHMGGFSPFFRIWGKSEQDISARAWLTGAGVKCVAGAQAGHLSRQRFPYPVTWSDVEYNQVIMARTVFSESVAQAFEGLMQPLPVDTRNWLAQVNYLDWRHKLQSRRKMSDEEFLRRFVPNAPELLLQAAKPADRSKADKAALQQIPAEQVCSGALAGGAA